MRLSTFTPLAALAISSLTLATAAPTESDYYPIHAVRAPEGVIMEVGGVATLPEGRVAVSTRRGEVWIIGNPTMEDGVAPHFRKFAEGLHEPLGLLFHEGAFYAAQRGELTRLVDSDGDEIADRYETVTAWPLSSHYHEYTFGPALASDGSFFVTTNVAFGDEEWWRGESRVLWRGWTLKIHPDGTLRPWATGMRSPAGLGMFEGELFYTENQGDWVGSGGIWHVTEGSFSAHPAGLRWSGLPGSPVSLTEADFSALLDHRKVRDENGRFIKPENINDEADPDLVHEFTEKMPQLSNPAVILPHGILGVSNSEIVVDNTDGAFGPFAGQLFVGDQGQSKVMRVSLEKVEGAYQGVAFDFRSGFQSGVLRLAFSDNGTLFAGETNRGWGSAGEAAFGLEFLDWSGKTPFEMQTVRAKPDGFEIEFTQPVNESTALDLASYSGRSYIYKYHPVYGSPQINSEPLRIIGVTLSDDGKRARLAVENLRPHYVHELHLRGIKSASERHPLLHPSAYYTLNAIPSGDPIDTAGMSTRRSEKEPAAPVSAASPAAAIDEAAINELLAINACTACHSRDKRMVGPSFAAIAQRDYTPERIVDLIYNPEPSNWPDFATPMAPMTHVPEDQALEIARWIISLQDAAKAPSP